MVLGHGGKRHSAKVLTTPRAPEEGMLEGISRVLAPAKIEGGDRLRLDLPEPVSIEFERRSVEPGNGAFITDWSASSSFPAPSAKPTYQTPSS